MVRSPFYQLILKPGGQIGYQQQSEVVFKTMSIRGFFLTSFEPVNQSDDSSSRLFSVIHGVL